MFKRLKEKVIVSSPIAVASPPREANLIDIDDDQPPLNQSTPNRTVSVANSSAQSSLDNGGHTQEASGGLDLFSTANDSTTTAVNLSTFELPEVPGHPVYTLPSDTESEAETETVVNLQAFSKEELFQKFRAVERSSVKYKNKYKQVFTAFNQAERERAKLSDLLTKSQDKSFQRISELREQVELEKKSRKEFETTLEGKDIELASLKTEVSQMKESASPLDSPQHLADSLATLKEKVKRQEQLLAKCKDTIKANKEKQLMLSNERDALKTRLEEATTSLQRIESEKTSLLSEEAEALRKSVSRKDEEMATLKETFSQQIQDLQADADRQAEQMQLLSSENEELKAKAKEQLDKSREIIRKLTEDKKQLTGNLATVQQSFEKATSDHEKELSTLRGEQEEEKAVFMQQVSRVKSETLTLVQEESEKELKKAVEARDRVWEERMSQMEDEAAKKLAGKDSEIALLGERKDREIEQAIAEKNSEMLLALEDAGLQNTAAASQFDSQKTELMKQIEQLKAELSSTQAACEERLEQHQSENMLRVSELTAEASRQNEHNQQQVVERVREELELEGARRLNELVQQHSQELESKLRAHQQEMENLESEHKAALTDMKQQCDGELSQLQGRLGEELAALKESMLSEKESAMKESCQSYEEKLVEQAELLSDKWKIERDGLIQEHQNSLSEKEASYTSARDLAVQATAEEYKEQLQQLHQQHQTELSNLKSQLDAESERRLKDLTAEHESEVSDLTNKHQAGQSDVSAKHKLEIEELSALSSRQLGELNDKHQSELEALRTEMTHEFDVKIADMSEQHSAALEKQTVAHEQRVNELVAQHTELTQRYERDTAHLLSQHTKELELLQSESTSQVDSKLNEITESLAAQHAEELSRCRQDHERERSQLQEHYDNLMKLEEEKQTEVETELHATRESLKKELADLVRENEQQLSSLEEAHKIQLSSKEADAEKLSALQKEVEDLKLAHDKATEIHRGELESLKGQHSLEVEQRLAENGEKVEERVKELNDRLEVLSQQIGEEQRQQSQLLEENSQLKQEIETVQENHKSAVAELGASKQEFAIKLNELHQSQESQLERLKVDAEQKLSEVKGELSKYEEEVRLLKEQLTSTQADGSSRESELAAAHETEISRISAEHRQTIGDYQGRLDNLLSKLNAAVEMAQGLEEKQELMEEQHQSDVGALNRKLASLGKQSEDSQQIVTALRTELLEAQHSLEQQKSILEETNNTLSSTQAELATKTSEVADIKDDLEAKTAELAGVKNDLEAKTTELAGVKNDIEVKATELTSAKNNLEVKATELAEVKNDLESKTSELAGVRETLARTETDLSDQEGKYELLKEKAQKKLHELKKQLEEKNILLSSAEQGQDAAVTSLKENYEQREKALEEKLESEREEYRASLEVIQGKLDSSTADLEKVRKERLSLEERLEAVLQELPALQDQISQHEKERNSLTEELNKGGGRVQELEAELSNRKSECEELSQRLASVTEQAQVSAGRIDKYERTEKELREKCEQLELAQRSAFDELNSIRVEHATLLQTSHASEQERVSTETRFTELETKVLAGEVKLESAQSELEAVRSELVEAKEGRQALELSHSEELSSLVKSHGLQLAELEATSLRKLKEWEDKVKSRMSQLKTQNIDKSKIIEELNEKLTVTKDELEARRSDLATLQSSVKSHESQAVEAVKEIEQMQLLNERLKVEGEQNLSEKSAEVTALETQLEDLRSQIDSIAASHSQELEGARSTHQTEVSVITETVRKLEENVAHEKDLAEELQLEVNALRSRVVGEDGQQQLVQKYEDELEKLKAEHRSEVNQLCKEAEQKLKEKDDEFQRVFADAYAKSEAEEKAAATEIERLQGLLASRNPETERLLADKDRHLHEVVSEYEEKLSSANELMRQRETELLAQIGLLQENITFTKSASESPQGSPSYASHMSSASTPVPKAKKAVHFKDDMHTVELEAEYSSASMSNHSGTVLAEPTELEFLRNILYEYMMGKETQTLAKVITSVMKFSKEQTSNVLSKEKQKVTGGWLSGS